MAWCLFLQVWSAAYTWLKGQICALFILQLQIPNVLLIWMKWISKNLCSSLRLVIECERKTVAILGNLVERLRRTDIMESLFQESWPLQCFPSDSGPPCIPWFRALLQSQHKQLCVCVCHTLEVLSFVSGIPEVIYPVRPLSYSQNKGLFHSVCT